MNIVGTVVLLATEAVAKAEHQGGFGLNLDIFETNLINIVILVGILVYFGRKVLTNILTELRLNIETEITQAEARSQEAAVALSKSQEQLTQAQAEAQRIRQAAEENAKTAREAILAQAARDVENLKETSMRDLDNQRERALAELREQVVGMALGKVESELRTGVADDAQHTLIDRSIALLENSK